jgi:hypothetical protein
MANIMDPQINPTITSTQTSTPIAPDWYNNFLSGIVARGGEAVAGGGIAAPSPLQTQAWGAAPTAIAAGQPQLAQATQTATGVATTPTSSLVNQYLNPYTQSVVQAIGDLGARQFREFTAPSMTSAGVATGQFGGQRAQDIQAKAARDAAANITAQQAQAMNTGWANALTAAQNQQNLGLSAASTLGNLSGLAQGQATSGLGTLSTLGAQQQALEQARLNYPMTGLQNYAGLVGGLNIPIGATQSVTGPAGAGQLTDSYLKQLLAGTSGVGGLLTTPLGSILGTDNKKTVGRSILDLIAGGSGGGGYTGTLPSNPNDILGPSGDVITGPGTGTSEYYANRPSGVEGYFWNPSNQLVDRNGDLVDLYSGY